MPVYFLLFLLLLFNTKETLGYPFIADMHSHTWQQLAGTEQWRSPCKGPLSSAHLLTPNNAPASGSGQLGFSSLLAWLCRHSVAAVPVPEGLTCHIHRSAPGLLGLERGQEGARFLHTGVLLATLTPGSLIRS